MNAAVTTSNPSKNARCCEHRASAKELTKLLQATLPPQIVMNMDTARVRRTDPITSHEAADSNDTAASRTFVMFALIEHGMLAQFELEQIADGLWSPSRIRTAVSELVERELVEFAGIYRLTPSQHRACRAQVWKVAE